MSFSYTVLVIWALFEGINDVNLHSVDLWVRGALLLFFVILAVLEALGFIKARLPVLHDRAV